MCGVGCDVRRGMRHSISRRSPAGLIRSPIRSPAGLCPQHEWHDGTSDRVVLICDLWHPELDVDATVVPMLNERQRDALNHARAGRHLLMTERTYSTGSTRAPEPSDATHVVTPLRVSALTVRGGVAVVASRGSVGRSSTLAGVWPRPSRCALRSVCTLASHPLASGRCRYACWPRLVIGDVELSTSLTVRLQL